MTTRMAVLYDYHRHVTPIPTDLSDQTKRSNFAILLASPSSVSMKHSWKTCEESSKNIGKSLKKSASHCEESVISTISLFSSNLTYLD